MNSQTKLAANEAALRLAVEQMEMAVEDYYDLRMMSDEIDEEQQLAYFKELHEESKRLLNYNKPETTVEESSKEKRFDIQRTISLIDLKVSNAFTQEVSVQQERVEVVYLEKDDITLVVVIEGYDAKTVGKYDGVPYGHKTIEVLEQYEKTDSYKKKRESIKKQLESLKLK